MNLTFDEKWLAEYCARTGQPVPGAQPAAKRSKYGNRRTQLDGRTFDSRHESEVYARLKLETQAGEHAALLCRLRGDGADQRIRDAGAGRAVSRVGREEQRDRAGQGVSHQEAVDARMHGNRNS